MTDYHRQMQISDDRLEEFRRIYKEATGEEITLEEAREVAQRLVTLYKLLAQPLPDSGKPKR
jgi:hypothetical protein